MCSCGRGGSQRRLPRSSRRLRLSPILRWRRTIWQTPCGSSGEIDEAEAHYRRAIEIDPNYAEAHNNLGLLLDDRGRRAEAAEQFRKALEINPQYVQAHNNLGVLLMNQGMMADAIVQFRAAVALDPKFDLAHGNLGRALSHQGQNTAAAAELRAFLRLQPDQPQVLVWLAWILATAPEDAVRSGQEAVALAEKAADLTAHRDAGGLECPGGRLRRDGPLRRGG